MDSLKAAENSKGLLALPQSAPFINPTRLDTVPLGNSFSMTDRESSLCSIFIIQVNAT
jgi:hypothetical protein